MALGVVCFFFFAVLSFFGDSLPLLLDGALLAWAFFAETADFCLPGFFGDATSCSSILP